ncbi:MAG TPA: hypothetical protein VFY29_11790 [Terriglobia bacterium]|nr:hypothetical protein [Terriglobia bacterium]
MLSDKDLLLQTYSMANRFAAHYSAMRTSLVAAAMVLAYGQFLKPLIEKFVAFAGSSSLGPADVVSALMALLLGIMALVFNWRFLKRTLACRAVLLSVECRKRDELGKHDPERLNKAGTIPWLSAGWVDSWKKWDNVPVEYGRLEQDFLKKDHAVQPKVFYGWGNAACIFLFAIILFICGWICLKVSGVIV